MTLSEVFPNWMTGEGIFSELGKLGVPWGIDSLYLDLEYFGNHSGDKTSSPLVNKLAVDGVLSSDSISSLANVIFNIHNKDWTRLYSALEKEYDPLSNYDKIETESINSSETGTDTTTLTGTETNNGTSSNSNIKNGSESIESAGSDIVSKTGTVGNVNDNSSENNVFGFNSQESVPSGVSNSATNSTDTYDLSNNTTYGKKDTKNYNNVSDESNGTNTSTITHDTTNTNTKDLRNESSRTLNTKGNIGVTTSQQLLESEFSLRMKNRFFNVVFADVDKILALQIY